MNAAFFSKPVSRQSEPNNLLFSILTLVKDILSLAVNLFPLKFLTPFIDILDDLLGNNKSNDKLLIS